MTDQVCAYEDCNRPATILACGRSGYNDDKGHPKPAYYCDEHANLVADEHDPEYVVYCPSCECRFGVN